MISEVRYYARCLSCPVYLSVKNKRYILVPLLSRSDVSLLYPAISYVGGFCCVVPVPVG